MARVSVSATQRPLGRNLSNIVPYENDNRPFVFVIKCERYAECLTVELYVTDRL